MSQEQDLQNKSSNDALLKVASQLLEQAGVNKDDFYSAISALTTAKQQNPKVKSEDNKNYVDKTPVYDDVDAFIYKRGDTKSGIWYFRIWDSKRRKAVFRSLKTTNKELAITTAKQLYRDISGKIEKGERLKQITTDELIAIWDKYLQSKITTTPHKGIVPKTYKSKRYWLNNWSKYINHLHLSKTPIDKIKPHLTRGFSMWLETRPKQTAQHTGARSREQINNNVNEVIKMYRQLAVRERYLSSDDVPQIDRLGYEIDDRVKRDIPTEQEYEDYWRFLYNNYITKKHNPNTPPEEIEKRKIFKEFILILANSGVRPKELLGVKVKEITELPYMTDDDKKKGNMVINIRKDNAKTGRSRSVVAPIRQRLERIYNAYKKIGITHEPEDFIFLNPVKNSKFYRKSYGRMIMNNRLKATLKTSGLHERLAKESRSLSLYGFRHFYAYLRLINGVHIHLLAENMGTSVHHLQRTYGHINTQLQAGTITKNMGFLQRTETELEMRTVAAE